MLLQKRIIVFATLLAIAIFISDLYLLLGVHSGLLYVIVLILTLNIQNKKSTFFAGTVVTIFIIIGYFFSPHVYDYQYITIINRVLTISTIWVTAIFIALYKNAQSTAQQGRERLNALFKNSNEGMLITNQKGEIIKANPAIRRMFGYGYKELIGCKVEVLISKRFIKKHIKNRTEFFAAPSPRKMGIGLDLYGKRKDGSKIAVHVSMSSFKQHDEIFVIEFIIDITVQKAAEVAFRNYTRKLEINKIELEKNVKARTAELKELNEQLEQSNLDLHRQIAEKNEIETALIESQNLYRSIAQNFPGGIISVLDEQYRFVFIDGKNLRYSGIDNSSLIGKYFFNYFASPNQSIIEKQLEQALNGKEATFEMSYTGITFFFHIVPIPPKLGTTQQLLVVAQDISEQKVAEQQIAQSLKKEKELGNLKSRFVSTASHEFRTPLGTILSSAELLARYNRNSDEDNRKRHIERIKRTVANMNELMNDFLSLDKIEAGKDINNPEKFDVTQFCLEIKIEMRHLLKKTQKINYVHNGDSNLAFLDKKLLGNILRNLISNAIKFSDAGNQIQLETSIQDEVIQFSVKDEGVGIPEADQKHIFETFYRANNVHNIPGTGLGLNIVRKYLDMMGGTVKFESKESEGTSFVIKFYSETLTNSHV